MKRLSLRVGMATLFFPLGLFASIKWDKTTVEITASPNDKEAKAAYVFQNMGDSPVEIRSVQTSCGCTAAAMDKKIYGPGEKGTLNVKFTYGSRKGHQEKSILVQTNEKDNAKQMLLLKVDIPDDIHISKKTLTWQMGDPSEAQSFEIKVDDPGKVKVGTVKPIGQNFTASMEEVKKGTLYRVNVTPATTDHPISSTISIDVDDPIHRVVYLPVHVQP